MILAQRCSFRFELPKNSLSKVFSIIIFADNPVICVGGLLARPIWRLLLPCVGRGPGLDDVLRLRRLHSHRHAVQNQQGRRGEERVEGKTTNKY